MDKIILKSHNVPRNSLEVIDKQNNQYKLIVSDGTASIRTGYLGKDNDGYFVDPSGGPMIIEGTPLECFMKVPPIVSKIELKKEIGIIITLQK